MTGGRPKRTVGSFRIRPVRRQPGSHRGEEKPGL